ncbi:MAG: hypothetical protein V8T01_03955 [Oscillospiraceae bacterium]
MAASYFALYCYDKMSSPVLLIVMGVSAALLGGIWAFIPGFFKAKWNTNETLFTLMMNYIMIGIVRWLKGGPWEGRPARRSSRTLTRPPSCRRSSASLRLDHPAGAGRVHAHLHEIHQARL